MHCTRHTGLMRPVDRLAPRQSSRSVRIRLDDAGIDGKSFATHQSLGYAATQNRFKQMPECLAIAEPAMTVLGECRVIRDGIFQTQSTEPAVG